MPLGVNDYVYTPFGYGKVLEVPTHPNMIYLVELSNNSRAHVHVL